MIFKRWLVRHASLQPPFSPERIQSTLLFAITKWLIIYQAHLGSLNTNQQHLALTHGTNVKLCPQLIIIVNDDLTLPILYLHMTYLAFKHFEAWLTFSCRFGFACLFALIRTIVLCYKNINNRLTWSKGLAQSCCGEKPANGTSSNDFNLIVCGINVQFTIHKLCKYNGYCF